jgi:hypothetical protein
MTHAARARVAALEQRNPTFVDTEEVTVRIAFSDDTEEMIFANIERCARLMKKPLDSSCMDLACASEALITLLNSNVGNYLIGLSRQGAMGNLHDYSDSE